MSEALGVEPILSHAMERERDYDWLGAVEFYKKVLSLMSETDFLKKGQIQERVGYALYRAAMQAESVDQFRDRMRLAIANYENAKEVYRKMSEAGKTPRMLRCDATVAYMGYWLTSEVVEKKRLLEECWRLAKESLKAFDETGENLEYGKTYNQLASSAFFVYVREWNFQAGEKIIKEAMEHGERAVAVLSSAHDTYELARAYVRAGFYLITFGLYFVPDLDERERRRQKGQEYLLKAKELSEEAALLELASMSGGSGDELGWSVDEIIENYKKALGCSEKTKDKYLIGTALDWLAYATFLKAGRIEDPDKRLETNQMALKYAEDAKHQFSAISFVSPRGDMLWTEDPYANYYWLLAYQEVMALTDLSKRRDLFEKAAKNATQTIKLAERTGYPGIMYYAHIVLGETLWSLAQIQTSLEEKKILFEKAWEHTKEYARIIEQRYPFHYINRGYAWSRLADLKAELSDAEKDTDIKKSLLEEAIQDKEHGLQLYIRDISYFEKIGELSVFSTLGFSQYFYGELLNRLYGLTKSGEHQRRAIKAFEEAAKSYQKLDRVTRVAECLWKAAKGYDALSEHLKAAENFNLASDNYKDAAEEVPQFKDFYQEHAVYMQAWSEIEKARHHHARQEYGLAKEHYEKAAAMHKSLKQWSYLAPNYSAWFQVENAEDLSRREQSEEALQAFEKAAQLFIEAKKTIETELNKIENPDEKQMATNLIKSTDIRHEYCIGRIALEEAKILDKKGDHYSSSEKYGSAAQTFQKMTEASEPEQDRKELKLIMTLSRAWQKTMRAEAEESPNLYIEASQLFEEAKELTTNEKARMLTLGHSRFCKALEAGTKFADTRDAALHAAAIQQLESASNYYMKAGFQNASEYAKATELLLDAYLHMDNAKKEKDQEKKAKLYMMAEKMLQSSAGSFMKAEHPEKREQVLRLLEKVKEERELAISLTEVLHAPSMISTTVAFATPTPTHENAVGLEKFEHADIQANVITRQKDLKIGENLDLEIELVNAGKGPAILIKLAEVIPEGFDLTEKPETYRVEDSYLNMKGKRLDPLKTEEVRLVLKPRVQGVFPLKPKVLYLDENGKYKSHEPEPITITVKELGIKGWIRGEK